MGLALSRQIVADIPVAMVTEGLCDPYRLSDDAATVSARCGLGMSQGWLQGFLPLTPSNSSLTAFPGFAASIALGII